MLLEGLRTLVQKIPNAAGAIGDLSNLVDEIQAMGSISSPLDFVETLLGLAKKVLGPRATGLPTVTARAF